MAANLDHHARLSVAPMMDWTDRHCRYLHRLMSRHALLYTEMVTSAALVHGDPVRHLAFDAAEHPLALQLGGSHPAELARAARIGAEWGYDEINLNVGCPSDRVQSGAFGAVLMQSPDLVAECLAAMAEAQPREVTVKCRIGVDEQVPEVALHAFLRAVEGAGVRRVIVHARKAWLQGLSPKENRDIPPLDYELVARMKAEFPRLHISLNGGIESLETARAHLDAGFDGVMVGRAAYQRPADLLLSADRVIFEDTPRFDDPRDVVVAMLPYIAAHLRSGGRLHHVTRHMLGLFAGQTGARAWRRILSEGANLPGAGPELLEAALAATQAQAA
ncbi:MAG: tRNA dihydrouridine(20/20a) synthase DusA [Pseudomonadota bacterium]